MITVAWLIVYICLYKHSIESVNTPTQVLDLMEDDPFTTPQDAENQNATSCRVERYCQVPGVQYVLQSGDCIVCTSVIAPSTLVWRAGSLQNGDSVTELEELEAEQSTCVAVFRGGDSGSRAILKWLFRDEPAANAEASLLVLQGDMDGAVRYYITSQQGGTTATATAAIQPPRSGTLLELGEPVQFIVSFSTSASISTTMSATTDSSGSSGLLIVGCKGHARLLSLGSHGDSSSSFAGIPLAFEAPVQSIVFVESLGCFAYCSSGVTYGIRALDLMRRSFSSESASASNTTNKRVVVAQSQTEFSVKLPFVSV